MASTQLEPDPISNQVNIFKPKTHQYPKSKEAQLELGLWLGWFGFVPGPSCTLIWVLQCQ